ncbi:MAG: hypothetical protein QNJ41_04995 [Xenococcaceae cyanobacterium MO_188.B32]|nr:hypothetical protein [Xenococcaceae cyanobacterium MO_188.B32]
MTIRIDEGGTNLQDGEQVSAWIATVEKNRAIVAPFNTFIFRDRQPRYGDIIPVSPLAKMLTNLEAIIGQLYPAILIAILVGGYLSQRSK